jgi:hypothetical protein
MEAGNELFIRTVLVVDDETVNRGMLEDENPLSRQVNQ